MIKKRLMELVWRLQASQMLIGIVVWSLMLTGIFYSYVSTKFNNFGLGAENVFFGMVILFLITFALIFAVGLIFDKMKFWKEQQVVAVERNPYMSSKLCAKEIFWIKVWLLATKVVLNSSEKKNEEIEKQIKFFENWISNAIKDDEKLREEVKRIEEFAGL
ncbi:MAG: hypothetical protein AB1779_05510 [Candidatus Thermoplasmatota archaeon]